jgi:uncharacterized phage-associated protein
VEDPRNPAAVERGKRGGAKESGADTRSALCGHIAISCNMAVMDAPYSAAAVANWFLTRAAQDKVPLDPMKLQKLIYFAHGWCLALTGKPLIDEHIEAWDYGPVVPSVYHEFKDFGRRPIDRPMTDLASVISEGLLKDYTLHEPKIIDDPDIEKLLERVWEVYGKLSGVTLANMTHAPDGAWHKAYTELAQGRRGVDIPDAFIVREFSEKAKRGQEARQIRP